MVFEKLVFWYSHLPTWRKNDKGKEFERSDEQSIRIVRCGMAKYNIKIKNHILSCRRRLHGA